MHRSTARCLSRCYCVSVDATETGFMEIEREESTTERGENEREARAS
jgi:hypothetical protein